MTSDDKRQGGTRGLLLGTVFALLAMAAVPLFAAGIDEDGRIPFPKPGSHRGKWIEYHGRSVGAAGGSQARPGEACLACHDRQDCTGCHGMTMPRDHTNFWRTRSHGLAAGGNRERCFVCHRQDYCIRCHSETAPRSHTAGWRQRHCTWCHYAGGLAPADGCGVCHKQAPHTSAPHPVNGALNCRSCH